MTEGWLMVLIAVAVMLAWGFIAYAATRWMTGYPIIIGKARRQRAQDERVRKLVEQARQVRADAEASGLADKWRAEMFAKYELD